jgi:hypothetical protein
VIASLSALATSATAQAVLSFDEKAAIQIELHDLLAREEIPIAVKLTWSPLLEYDNTEAIAKLASLEQSADLRASSSRLTATPAEPDPRAAPLIPLRTQSQGRP